MYDLKTDKEFRSLVFPADQKYYDNLEEDIFNSGCKNPIIVWENIIIDGCKRYEICKNWELPFTIKYMNFNNRFEAVSWICQNQLQRDDITEEMHRYLIGKYFEAEKSAYLSTVDSINSERKSSGFQYHIARRMGKAFSLVASTIYKYELYTKALDNIGVKSERMAEKILSGKLKLSQENTVELSRYSKEEIRKLNNIVTIDNINYMNYSEMIRRLKPKDFSVSSAASAERKSNSTVLPIKEIPAYDPDAEISGLIYTIPSWIGSIERTCSLADFSKTTSAAREKLLLKLSDLCKAAYIIKKMIEEVNAHG